MTKLPSLSPARAILTRVAAHAGGEPAASTVSGARIAIGFVPRLLAYRVNVSCPLPTGIATTSGAIPGKIIAGARTLPCCDVTSTRSPCAIPARAAVCGLISTQLLHIADVSGSGISCSHGRCAADPSPNCDDGYGWKCSGYCDASPSKKGCSYCAFVCCRFMGGCTRCTAGDGGPALFATSSAVFQGSATGDFSLPATSISTSTVDRVLCSGFITGPATVVTASIDPDSGVLSTQDSRNE